MPGSAQVTIKAGAISRLLNRFGGPGDRLLRNKAERVAAQARLNSALNGTIPLGIIVGPVANGAAQVISTNPHSILVHNGSRPHIIRPRRSRARSGRGPAYLRFEVNGRVVYAREVRHPGYRGNPFLTDALRQVG